MRAFDRVKFFQVVEKTIVWAIIALSCVILIIPLLVQRDVLFLYVFGKVIVLRSLIEIVVALWLFLCITKKIYRPNFRNPLIAAFTILNLIFAITTLTAYDPNRAFWSYQERMMGFLTLFHLYLWFLVLSSVLRTWKEWSVLFYTTLGTLVAVGLYGIGQKFHLPFLYMEADSLRMASTLGNSLYLGAYALIHIFISLFLFFQSKNNLARLFCFFVSIFSIYLLLASASRGVTLAAIICALGLGSMATLIVSNDRVRMLIRTIVISGIGAAFLVTILLYSPAGKK